jgi:hypothetical protein
MRSPTASRNESQSASLLVTPITNPSISITRLSGE